MRDDLALSSVLHSIAGIEKSSCDGNECIIVFTNKESATSGHRLEATHAFKKPLPWP